ncbi:hypothetical protein [Heliophilum fasciatum]|uniref:Uncharacterized protein n=1 Tax=Heliophilum fasciatum TaxID=35700 RepID=A0A4R2RCS8_9FIRM|nr:hypothetical protein [Heliophilum fasciatum]MCW2279472.1 hypothetical protein [Heliophilum fasciatum]TCP59777.1 hypothetical protein EDD73_1491 [Heliophilum fasciatum]
MHIFGDKNLKKKYGTVYDLFGIYLDWQIDHNIIDHFGIKDPHGIQEFEDFYAQRHWQIARVQIHGVPKLLIDIDLERFSYCSMTGLEKMVLEENRGDRDILKRLMKWSKKTGVAPLEQMKYYLGQVAAASNNGSGKGEVVFFGNGGVFSLEDTIWKIVKIRTIEGYKVGMARDIEESCGFALDEEDLEEGHYDEYEAEKRVHYWCEKLGLPEFNSFKDVLYTQALREGVKVE